MVTSKVLRAKVPEVTFTMSLATIRPSRSTSVYVEIVNDFIAHKAESMQVAVEGVKPATLRAGLRTAIKRMVADEVRIVQRGEETFLVKASEQ